MTTARGYRLATSLGGTFTGRGAHLVVMDDPQKPEEALSEASRNYAAQWFDTTLLSRLDSKSEGGVILVMSPTPARPTRRNFSRPIATVRSLSLPAESDRSRPQPPAD